MKDKFQEDIMDLIDGEVIFEDIEEFDDGKMFESLNDRFCTEPCSPEELLARRKEENDRRVALGVFPVAEDYQSVCPTDMEFVEANPERYIVPECIPACKELWSKNVYTFMVCDFLDLEAGWAWICIKDNLLSDRNKEILASLSRIPNVKVITNDSYYKNTAYIEVPFVGQAAQDALLDIAKRFEMQDVPEGYAYRISGPDNPVNEGEIVRDDRIYFSEYHLNKHLDYIKSLGV